MPLFPEVHKELNKTWKAPYTAWSHLISFFLTTLNGVAARGYVVCSTRRNHPRIPSKACKLTSALATKAYSAAGQAISALHAMAILQVHQPKALKSCMRVALTQDLCRRCPFGDRLCPLGDEVHDAYFIIQPLFHCTQEDQWVTTSLGSTGFELVPSQASVQDDDTEAHSCTIMQPMHSHQ